MASKNIWITIIVIVVLILGGYWAYGAWSDRNAERNAEANAVDITSFTVEKPNFVVKGKNLAKVEVWSVPTGTGITEANHVRIGNAARQGAAGQDERWTLPIPVQPLSSTEIYAKGFDAAGVMKDKISLSYKGATDIYNNVWGPVTEQENTVALGEKITFGELEFTPTRIVNDSRCAQEVVCVTAGDVVVEGDAKTPFKQGKVEVRSSANPTLFDGYFIEIKNVMPVKTMAAIPDANYRITFIISRDAKL